MAESFTLEIISPAGMVYSGKMKHVRAPGVEGSFGVLPNHTPFITALQIGTIDGTTEDGKPLVFATSGGLAEVHGDRVVILAETAEDKAKIDLERARAAKERAEGRMEKSEPNIDPQRARLALARAVNRMKVVQG